MLLVALVHLFPIHQTHISKQSPSAARSASCALNQRLDICISDCRMISEDYMSETAAARNNGDFVQSSCILGEQCYQSVSGLVVSRQLVGLFIWYSRLLRRTYTMKCFKLE